MSRRQMTKKLADIKTELVEAYENGHTVRQIARIYEVAPGTVRNRLLEAGAKLRPTGRRKKNHGIFA